MKNILTIILVVGASALYGVEYSEDISDATKAILKEEQYKFPIACINGSFCDSLQKYSKDTGIEMVISPAVKDTQLDFNGKEFMNATSLEYLKTICHMAETKSNQILKIEIIEGEIHIEIRE